MISVNFVNPTNHAVRPLMMMPIADTIITVLPAIGSGSAKRWTASQAIAPVVGACCESTAAPQAG